MKKWILKKEITEILNTYSIRKNEFEAIETKESEYYYKSKFARGYYINISEEIEKGGKNTRDLKTGRIIVKHIKENGKITYYDIWERNKNGKIEFAFRNLWNQPISDADYIKDLKEDVEKMKEQYQKLINDTKYKELKNEKEELKKNLSEQFEEFQKLIIENENLKKEIENIKNNLNKENSNHLQEEIKQLQQENQKLKNEKKHNARGAGRKPSQERLNTIEQVKKLLEAGTSEQEIEKQFDISKATFYRYKKSIKN